MQVKLMPTLNVGKKRQAKAWLEAQLASNELAEPNVSMGWLAGGVAIYINEQPKILISGYWQAQESVGYFQISCGSFDTAHIAPPKVERLAILGGVIHAVGLWDDLAAQFSAALGRVLLDSYRSCCLDMVEAPKPATKMAFSADKQQVALQYTDEPKVWYLPSGEPVKVDESWHQVAAA